MGNARADVPIIVMWKTNIPLVIVYNGNHFESSILVSDKDIQQTISLVQAFKQNQYYTIPIFLKDTYNFNDNKKNCIACWKCRVNAESWNAFLKM